MESVGPKLIALLDDVKRPASQRLEASLWLGKLRYMHAIPTLIKHITLIDPNAIVSGDPPDSVQDALIDFGDAAVPSIVDAIMADNEEGQHRLFCLSTAIAHKSQPAAWTYAKGLEATNPNPDKMFKSRMAYLMQFIKPQVKPESKKTTP